jgi:hypothetical protein
VIAVNYLVGGQVEQARRFLDDAWNTLRTADPSLARRLVYLRILLAEAQRRCGTPTTAVRTLHESLTTATGRPQFRTSFTGVLEAALIAADLGDNAASRQLATRWDTHRSALDLPIPIGFTEPATGTLGLSPAPTAAPSARWNPDALHASVATATAWCTSQLPAPPQPRRTTR